MRVDPLMLLAGDALVGAEAFDNDVRPVMGDLPTPAARKMAAMLRKVAWRATRAADFIEHQLELRERAA